MTNTKKMVISGLFAALCCVATLVIKVPIAAGGYLNLGDAFVLASGYFLGGPYGFLAAAVGSALADVFSGYIIYAPVTFIIKGIMALLVHIFNKKQTRRSLVLGIILAEAVMFFGYYAFDSCLYGVKEALATLPFNLIQAVAGGVVGIVLMGIFKKIIKI